MGLVAEVVAGLLVSPDCTGGVEETELLLCWQLWGRLV